MDSNELENYNVKIDSGSGVLFQPMCNTKYTYILTARHNIEPISSKAKSNQINIKKEVTICFYDSNIDDKILEIIEGESYFPHKIADLAILKSKPIPGNNKLLISNEIEELKDAMLCGFPTFLCNNPDNSNEENYTKHILRAKISLPGNTCRAQLENANLDQDTLIGMSGGGIFREQKNYFELLGIQSKIIGSIPNGQIDFTPAKLFNEIVKYQKNRKKLVELLPNYLMDFKHLITEVFKLDGATFNDFKSKVKSIVKNRFSLYDVTPIEILNSEIKDKLLIKGENISSLHGSNLWIAWAEFLVLLSLEDNSRISFKRIKEIFKTKRLIHSEESSFVELVPNLLNSNLEGLEKDSQVFVSSEKYPGKREKRKLSSRDILYIGQVNSNGDLEIDKPNDFKNVKTWIHIKAFEEDCLVLNEDLLNKKFSSTQINELIIEIKNKANEVFQN